MTAVTLLCARCNEPTGPFPHFPHEPDCTGDDDCRCAVVVCEGCCACEGDA